MAEVDRRGFLRLRRRSDADEDAAADAAPPPPEDPEIRQLADLTERLLADLEAEGEERLAEGALLNSAYDRAYMRVTAGHIVFSVATGISGFMKTSDVVALEMQPEVENDRGHGPRQLGIIRSHHPADLPNVTRTNGFRFPAGSPLIEAIRTACDLPEPEPEAEEEDGTDAAEGADAARDEAAETEEV